MRMHDVTPSGDGLWSRGLSRRELLVLAAGATVLTSCSAKLSPDQRNSPLQNFLSGKPFFIAHRGSGDNWPEHTAYAYSRAAARGAKAIEVSLSSTSDGVLVCHHLTNTKKLTGRDWNIAEHSFAELATLKNDAREWLGPASPLEPVPKVKDVLDTHAAGRVIFIEDKQGTNTAPVLDLLNSYPDATEHFVWKQPGGMPLPAAVREHGYKSWGYFEDGSGKQLDEQVQQFDLLGIYHDASDEDIRRLLSYGKPVICWEVHTRWMRARLEALGVQGIMCSNLPYVTTGNAQSSHDSFATGLRAPGDLPWNHEWESQPLLRPGTSSCSIRGEGSRSYVMGSMCPIEGDAYTLTFEIQFPGGTDGKPVPKWEAGLAFGQPDDQPFRPWNKVPVGGYFLSLNAKGDLELYRQEPGRADPVQLASVATPPPIPGKWMRFRAQVTPSIVRISRLDGQELAAEAEDKTYRGGYFSLYKSHAAAISADFRSLSVAPA